MAKIKIRDYACFRGLETTITPEVKEALDLTFPDAYKHADTMARISKFIKENNGSPYCTLPFCHTVEGEALGGRVNYGDEHIGPRAGDPIVDSLDAVLDLPDFDFTTGRIKEVLDAIEILKDEGELVTLEVSGPISALNNVVDPKHIFIAMRKDKETLIKVYEKMKKNLLAYIKEAVDRGVDLISYADSAGAVNILGDKMLAAHVEDFLLDFLEEVKPILDGKALIHLCPKSAYAIVDSGHGDFVEVEVDSSLTYGEALGTAMGKEIILGDRCINNINSHMKQGVLRAIHLKD